MSSTPAPSRARTIWMLVHARRGRWVALGALVAAGSCAQTELRVWQHLADAGMTVLAVSHRAVAFERADRVLRIDEGHLVDMA